MTFQGANTQGYREYRHNSTGMIFVYLPGGKFKMGCDDDSSIDNPVHEVTLDDFLIGKYEVTQAEWQKFGMGNPAYFSQSDNCPVEQVSWQDCNSFCQMFGLRLPTEAEWEYACRAGSATYYYWGSLPDNSYMWYLASSENSSHPAGQKQPNAFGLFDMSGNLWEWCNDWYNMYYYTEGGNINPPGPEYGENRILRGGSWYTNSDCCTSALRSRTAPSDMNSTFGFRCACSPK